MELAKLRHLVIEGPIGVGKTSLAKRLADRLGADLLLEAPDQNPFLAKFYRDPPRHALPTQLFFLFQRIAQLGELAQQDFFARPVVSDFLLDKDPLFARLTLGEEEFNLYRRVYDGLKPQAPQPDLVIQLVARPEILIDRIARRGKLYEAGISESYLRALTNGYAELFYRYDAAPLLIVNTENLNPIDSDEDFALFISRIESMRGRREFFNRGE